MAIRKRRWIHAGRRREAWSVDLTAGDPPERVRRSGFPTRRDAEEWERAERERIEAESRQRRLPAEHRRRVTAAEKTMADLARSWLDACKRGSDSGIPVEGRTYQGYAASARLHITPRIGSVKIGEIDGPLLQGFKADLVRETTAGTARRVLQHLRQMLNHAVRAGWMAASPGGSIRLKVDHRAKRQLRMPTENEFNRLLAAVSALQDEATSKAARCRRERPKDPKAGAAYQGVSSGWRGFGLMLRTLGATGLRISEVLALRWVDLDLADRPTLRVTQRAGQDGSLSHPKSGSSRRTVALPKVLARDLAAWRDSLPVSSPLVFPSPEGAVQRYPNLYRRHLAPAMRRAGLVTPDGKLRFALHAPRHYHASALIAAGLNVKEIADQLGHADATLTLTTYSHIFSDAAEARRDAVERVHARLVDADPADETPPQADTRSRSGPAR